MGFEPVTSRFTVLQSLFFILFFYYFATHNELQAVLK